MVSDGFVSLVKYKLRLKNGCQTCTTGRPAREKSRIHSFTGAADAITIFFNFHCWLP